MEAPGAARAKSMGVCMCLSENCRQLESESGEVDLSLYQKIKKSLVL